MTVSRQPDSPATPEVIVRDYAEGDYGACRSLWKELTEYHRSIYGDPSIGGDDPGAGFDDYLATSQRMGSWVAESHGRVIGLTGLFDRGRSGEVEPVVVAEAARDQGIGRMLISRVVEEARARGYEYLAIRPVARNVAPDISANAEGSELIGYTGAIQAAGHPLGFLNPALYLLHASAVIRDVPPVNPADPPVVIGAQPYFGDGNDYLTTLGEDQAPLRATAGYDDETGLGTPGPSFVTAFARFKA